MHAPGEMAMSQGSEWAGEDVDYRLVRATLAGDMSAFDALVERHWQKVASVAGRFQADPNEVDDAVQETFVLAFRHLRRYRAEASFRTWLLRIAVNVCRSRRTAPWQRRVSLVANDELSGAGSVDVQRLAEQQLSQEELAKAVQQLPEKLRLPLILRFYEELSGPEIAAVLGWNESTVWSRIYAACRELKKRLVRSGNS